MLENAEFSVRLAHTVNYEWRYLQETNKCLMRETKAEGGVKGPTKTARA